MTRRTRDLAVAFRDHWDRHFALPAGSRAVVAVSGGLDSMSLLALLAREGAAEAADLVAAHFDHGTRGADSAGDGRFVAEVAQRWGVAVRLGRGDAPARAAETGRGPMAAARELRYAFLRETAESAGAAAIVTAHQRDDRVETTLLRLARGTSVDGLGALKPIDRRRGIWLMRPLLPFSRAAIEAWAERTGVPFRDDPSNRSERYPRTRIRRDVLPRLREINPRADEAIVRLAALAAADAAYLGERARAHLEEATLARDGEAWSFSAAALAGAPDPILSRAVLAGWAWVAPTGARPPAAEWVEGAIEFLRGGRGGRVPCPGGGEIRRSGPRVTFERAAERRKDDGDEDG